MEPFFSVVIPTYNRVDVLSRSIDSVLKQTFIDFELIIIDNGSTDGTQAWLENYYQDSRLTYHYQEGSGSPASPRNKGMLLAKGSWTCLLDSDDMWVDTKLNDIYEVIKNDNLDVVCHNERVFYEDSNSYGNIFKYGPTSRDFYKDMLIFGNRLSTSATSIRTEFLQRNHLAFNESNDFAIVEDYDLWLNLARAGANFKFLSKSLGFYTVGGSNMISDSELYCNNLGNLLKFHAFSVQKFTSNKAGLWQILKLRSDFCKIRFSKNGRSFKVFSIMKIAITHPINFSILFIERIKKKSLSYLGVR